MSDIVAVLNLQAKSRRNAGRAVRSLVAHRRECEEVERTVRNVANVLVTRPLAGGRHA